MLHGTPSADGPTLVRVHLPDTLCDLLGGRRDDCHLPLDSALERVAAEECGVVVVLGRQEEPRQLIRRIRHYHLEDEAGTSEPASAQSEELRTYGIGAQILSDLGVRNMRVLGTPKRVHGLSGFGLEVVGYTGS
jgi:3,4-dihydroxy 2-butanone 4-phosphate synthase/GTP cyclohydrolase II